MVSRKKAQSSRKNSMAAITGLVVALCGCGNASEGKSTLDAGAADADGLGPGALGTGGLSGTGGDPGTGGLTGMGGDSGTGGTPATGGAPGTGGMPPSTAGIWDSSLWDVATWQ